jgi:Protein tyrosine and serine/threonine kinase
MDNEFNGNEELLDVGLVSYATLDNATTSTTSAQIKAKEPRSLFLLLLGLAQYFGIDFVPLTWNSMLEGARRGGTAEIRQMVIDLRNAFAFKRLAADRPDLRSRDLMAFTAEVAVLCHPTVREHPNLVTLEGICWEVIPKTEEVWPVLLFEKASHGDLMAFMERGPGKSLTFSERLELCAEIADAIAEMHENCQSSRHWCTTFGFEAYDYNSNHSWRHKTSKHAYISEGAILIHRESNRFWILDNLRRPRSTNLYASDTILVFTRTRTRCVSD